MVVLIHCIEHIPEPVTYLAEARRYIEPGGRLLIQVPDAELNPFDLVVADHASHFVKATIAAVVEAAGYELIGLRQRHCRQGDHAPGTSPARRRRSIA